MLRTALVLTLSMHISIPSFASHRDPSLHQQAFNAGRNVSWRVFGPRARTSSHDAPAERIYGLMRQQSDEMKCLAEAQQRHDDAIRSACKSGDVETCENAKRVNAALLRTENLKCEDEFPAASEIVAASEATNEAAQMRERVSRKRPLLLFLGLLLGVATFAGTLLVAEALEGSEDVETGSIG